MTRVRKKCAKCGTARWVSSASRRCKQVEHRMGGVGVWCWGDLVVAPVKSRAPRSAPRPQDVATAKLAHAQKNVDAYIDQIKRATTRLSAWQKKANYYAKQAARTDADIEAERERRKQLAEQRPRRRAIKLDGVVP